MSRTNGRKEVTGSYNGGTSARTRPLSFEEIMLKRKLAADGKERTSILKEHLVQNDVKLTSAHMDSARDNRSTKYFKEEKKERSLKTKEKIMKAKDGNLGSTYKHKPGSNEMSKSNYTSSNKDKERTNENQNNHRSKDDKMQTSFRNDLKRKQMKQSMEKDKHDNRDRKSREEIQRKEYRYADEKNKSETEYFSLRKFDKYDSERLQYSEYAERNDRRKEGSKPYFEEPKSKRKRSRSPGQEPERYRSVSSSPRAHKRSYRGWEHEHSSLSSFKEKSRRKHSDGDKLRTSGNGGYNSSNYHKHGSRLGGYSPRKRRPEAPHKSPSPILPSQERKAAKWDQLPSEARNSGFMLMPSNDQTTVTKIQEPASTAPVTTATTIPQRAPLVEILSSKISASVDSVQLTQATRPMRRLYVDNLPASASEKAVVDFLNDLLVSSGVHHIKGTSPCINCILNKERNQALVEFLTPQDATSALTFDGRSFSGALLKFRRTKDFVEALTGAPEKRQEEIRAVADIVRDSPHKIFIGGISEDISSSLLEEIVSAYGDLKSYRFGFEKKHNGPCAFLEYEDHAVTLKACSGLNGMKLGGHILTVVQALPDFQVEEKTECAPCYDIPVHAKPLLAPSTKVLRLKNVFNEEFMLLSESELEEVLDDVRLECTRFGTVKEVNLVRYNDNQVAVAGASETCNNEDSIEIECRTEDPSDQHQHSQDLMPEGDIGSAGDTSNGSGEDVRRIDDSSAIEIQHIADVEIGQQLESNKDTSMNEEEIGPSPGSSSPKLDMVDAEIGNSACRNVTAAEPAESTIDRMDSRTVVDKGTGDSDEFAFEPGSIFVEFLRKEAACTAAHSLHGRTYGEQIVTAGFFPYDKYTARFHGSKQS
ncbi:uncharacterized protein LOC122020270 isoform X1 [Zingiber officinale]|uniref:uncharacterized protein LOC122020270 isoform X1 n=1 Tax=Zingiber officinale TaxID=94328 RepID=UPI001C4D1071|nr:uncharacterized protein LOC122020270 isoform X1 [Zingiber officinale]